MFQLYTNLSTVEQQNSAWGPVIWIAAPQLGGSFLMVIIAGLVHGRSPVGSLPAAALVLGLPVAEFLVVTVSDILGGAALYIPVLRVLAAALGIGAALWLLGLVLLGRNLLRRE